MNCKALFFFTLSLLLYQSGHAMMCCKKSHGDFFKIEKLKKNNRTRIHIIVDGKKVYKQTDRDALCERLWEFLQKEILPNSEQREILLRTQYDHNPDIKLYAYTLEETKSMLAHYGLTKTNTGELMAALAKKNLYIYIPAILIISSCLIITFFVDRIVAKSFNKKFLTLYIMANGTMLFACTLATKIISGIKNPQWRKKEELEQTIKILENLEADFAKIETD